MKQKIFWVKEEKGKFLYTQLSNWKIFADQFYRASEFLFIEIKRDLAMWYTDYINTLKTEKEIDRGYIPQLDSVYFLQIGYCLENMLKGIMIFENPVLIQGSRIDDSITSHSLLNFAEKIQKIVFTKEEKKLLEFLTKSILWYSKYPIPKTVNKVIGSSGHKIDNVRLCFEGIYRKLSRYMQVNCDLPTHMSDYKFTAASVGGN